MNRRNFARMAAAAGAGTAAAPLANLSSKAALASEGEGCAVANDRSPGFGPLVEKVPLNTQDLGNVAGAGDLRGVPLLKLPEGFQYTAISIRGATMSDGNVVPGDHDGMAVFRTGRGEFTLVRNHELSIVESEAGSTVGCLTANGRQYDAFQGDGAGLGGGGTSNVVVDRHGRVIRDFVSLGGTIRNCAGGPTPWDSWLTCEENVTTPASDTRATKKHGYNFEVSAFATEAVDPVPLIDMGRMNHEAVSVDPWSGVVYETEDRGDSAYYAFVPHRHPSEVGHLQHGGNLYAMVIKPNQRSECDGSLLPTTTVNGASVVDTRGLARGASGSMLPFLGQSLEVEFVRLDDVDPTDDTLRFEAQSKGAALWWRGEGAWYFGGQHYWVTSGAGDIGEGQVWAYNPWTRTVKMVVESTNENLLDGPDNMTVGIDRTLYLCEDGSGGTAGDPNFSQRVVGVDQFGGLFDFAFNNLDTSEFAGACFSPGGRYFYVNAQGIGITYVIWRENRRRIRLRRSFFDNFLNRNED